MVDAFVETLQRDGFAILDGVLDDHARSAVRDAFAPLLAHTTDELVRGLVGKGKVFARIAEQPQVLELLDRVLMPGYLLSALRTNATRAAAKVGLHTEAARYFVPRPHVLPLAYTVLWAIDEIAGDDAPAVIPGSHRWDADFPADDDRGVLSCPLRAGQALVVDAAVWQSVHAAAPHALIARYCQPWLRPEEALAHLMAADDGLSPRLRALLG